MFLEPWMWGGMDAEIKLGILRKNSLKVKVYENVKKKMLLCFTSFLYFFSFLFQKQGNKQRKTGIENLQMGKLFKTSFAS